VTSVITAPNRALRLFRLTVLISSDTCFYLLKTSTSLIEIRLESWRPACTYNLAKRLQLTRYEGGLTLLISPRQVIMSAHIPKKNLVMQSSGLQVIVGGLPRTGTTSMSRALEILLKGKIFDGGNVSYAGNRRSQQQMLELAEHCPTRTTTDRTLVLHLLAQMTEDCVASSDQPGCYFLEELLYLYPEAKIIVTTRDEESWWASYTALWTSIHRLYPWSWLSPQLYRFCRFSFEFWRRVPQAVGMNQCPAWPIENQRDLYRKHAEYVRRVVPEQNLFYLDVKKGWEPLCEILEVEKLPEEPFPHVMQRNWVVEGGKRSLVKLKQRLWVGAVGLGLAFGIGGYFVRRIVMMRRP
jgi:hypothetical protein